MRPRCAAVVGQSSVKYPVQRLCGHDISYARREAGHARVPAETEYIEVAGCNRDLAILRDKSLPPCGRRIPRENRAMQLKFTSQSAYGYTTAPRGGVAGYGGVA